MRHPAPLFTLLLLLLLTSCRSLVRESDPHTRANTQSHVGTVEFQLVEEAYDHDYFVPVSKSYGIDSLSSLVLKFEVADAGAAPADPEWVMVNSWLGMLDNLLQERVALDAEVVHGAEKGGLRNFQQRVGAFDQKVDDLADQGRELMKGVMPETEIDAQLQASRLTELEFQAQWMRQRLTELQTAGKAVLSDSDELNVRVLCYRVSAGESQQLHVENYDTISATSDQVPDRWALDLNDAELADLKMQIEQSEKAVAVMRSIDENIQQLGSLQDAMLEQLRSLFDSLDDVQLQSAEDVQAALEEALAVLKRVRDAGNASQELADLIKNVEALAVVTDLAERATKLKDDFAGLLDRTDAKDLSDFLLGSQGLLTAVVTLKTDAGQWYEDAKKATEAIPKALSGLATVLQGASLEELKAALPEETQKSLDDYRKAVQPWLDVLRALIGRFGETKAAKAAVDFTNPEGPISRDLGDLRDGRVEIAGLVKPDDRIIVRIELRNEADGSVVDSAEYHLKVGREGWWGELSGQAILARGDSGGADATNWQPNVAALMSWHHHERFPTGLGETLNWLDPAFGIHAASLDMGPDSVEFGIGANLMLFDGLLFFGSGYNLSVPDDELYYFVGTDLFKLLGSLSGAGTGTGTTE